MHVTAALIPLLVLLMGFAATLSAAEVSLLRTPRVRVELVAASGDPRAGRLLATIDDLALGLNAILLTVLFTQVSVAAIGGYLAQRWFGGYGPSIAAVALTMVLFVYGEAIPKTLAVRHPLGVGLVLSRVIWAVVAIAGPATRILLRVSDLQIPGSGSSVRTAHTEEELRILMAQAAEAGEIDSADAELASRSFDFGDRAVRDILVPRARIVAVSRDAGLDAAIAVAVSAGHRRLPVYDGSLDTITGVVRLRDLAAAISARPDSVVQGAAREVLRVGPDLAVAALLSRFQQTGTTFAVVEEAATTIGIVTIEDVVAELVGEIEDLT